MGYFRSLPATISEQESIRDALTSFQVEITSCDAEDTG